MAKLQKFLGTRVYELRLKANITQAQLAERAGEKNMARGPSCDS